MDDVVHSFASRFGLTEEEDCKVVVRSDSQVRVADFLMVGKLMAHKNYNKEAFMTFFRNLWRPKSCVSIWSLSGDRFLFCFQFEEDRNFVLNGGPWSFKKMLLLLDVVKEGDVPQRIHLASQAFWVQAFGLPINYMTVKMGKKIG